MCPSTWLVLGVKTPGKSLPMCPVNLQGHLTVRAKSSGGEQHPRLGSQSAWPKMAELLFHPRNYPGKQRNSQAIASNQVCGKVQRSRMSYELNARSQSLACSDGGKRSPIEQPIWSPGLMWLKVPSQKPNLSGSSEACHMRGTRQLGLYRMLVQCMSLFFSLSLSKHEPGCTCSPGQNSSPIPNLMGYVCFALQLYAAIPRSGCWLPWKTKHLRSWRSRSIGETDRRERDSAFFP